MWGFRYKRRISGVGFQVSVSRKPMADDGDQITEGKEQKTDDGGQRTDDRNRRQMTHDGNY